MKRLIRVKPRASTLRRDHTDRLVVPLFGWGIVLVIALLFPAGCALMGPSSVR